jgi:Ca2+-binding EF-hand superfamily protein
MSLDEIFAGLATETARPSVWRCEGGQNRCRLGKNRREIMKTSTITALTLATLIGAVALPAVARDGYGPSDRGPRAGNPMMQFTQMDADGDGKITTEEMDAFRAARFAEQDADGDGFLTKDEIVAAETAKMQDRMGKRVAHMMIEQDADEDGKISLEELSAAGPGAHLFARLDADGDGAVSQDEIRQAMQQRRGGDGERGDHERGHGKKRWMNDDAE